MGKSNVVELEGRVGSTDPLTELLRTGARQLLQQAIEAEVQELLATPSARLLDDGAHVTFRYQESRTGQYKTRTVTGEVFIGLLQQHVLPRSFRRAHDFGFFHGNAGRQLKLIQWALGLIIPPMATRSRPPFLCACCHHPMSIIAFIRPAWRSG